MIINLEQKKAKHALNAASKINGGVEQGDPQGVVKKIPALVINCGLLATVAFAKEKGSGYKDTFEAFFDYSDLIKNKTIDEALKELCEIDQDKFRRITAEFFSYLGYLRRFVKGD